jgi:hypothetical protein
MAYRLRIVLDVEEDVFRDILVDRTTNLEDLHFIVAKSFGFKGKEMASFYRCDENWNQGEEIPLFNMSEDGSSNAMKDYAIKDLLQKEHDKLIYVYDFFSMWTFFVELTHISDKKGLELPTTILAFGNTPENAPEKHFTSLEMVDDFDYYKENIDLDEVDELDG